MKRALAILFLSASLAFSQTPTPAGSYTVKVDSNGNILHGILVHTPNNPDGRINFGDGLLFVNGVEVTGGGGGGGAPVNATYITQTANATLTNEFPLGSLLTGILKNTTTTGVPSIAVAGTDYVAPNAAITGATNTKITYDAKGLVTSGTAATTADIADSTDRRYVTDAQSTIIGNTSGTNTGDQLTFKTIAVATQSDIVADSTTDTLNLAAGSGISITTTAGTDTATITATGGGGSGTVTSVDVVTANGVSATGGPITGSGAFTFSLGAITPTSVVASGTVTGSNISGTNTGDKVVPGFAYTFDSATGIANPGAGNFRLNNADPSLATTMVPSNTDDDGNSLTAFFANLGIGDPKGEIIIKKIDDPTIFLVYDLTASADIGGTHQSWSVTFVTSSGALTDGDSVYLFYDRTSAQQITLTGDVTGTGSGSFVATIANDAVTLAKMADMATDSFLGRDTAGTGDPEVLSVATAKTLLNLTGTNSGDQVVPVNTSGITDRYFSAYNSATGVFTQTDITINGDVRWQLRDIDLTTWAGVTRASGFDTFVSTPTLANLNALVSDANLVPEARTISTTSPLNGGGDLSANRTLTIDNAQANGTNKGAASFTAADFNDTTGNISLDYTNGQAASGSTKGFLAAADWTTFNGKQPGDAGLTSLANAPTIDKIYYLSALDTWTAIRVTGGINFETGVLSIIDHSSEIVPSLPTVASAGTIDVTGIAPDNSQIDVTGTTGPITEITIEEGRVVLLRFPDGVGLTHSSTLQLPGGENIPATVGGWGRFYGGPTETICTFFSDANDYSRQTFDNIFMNAASSISFAPGSSLYFDIGRRPGSTGGFIRIENNAPVTLKNRFDDTKAVGLLLDNLTTGREVYFPDLDGTIAYTSGAQTLTNKTINASQLVDASVSLAKLANIATDSFLGRDTAGTGVPEVLSIATAKTLLDLSGTNTGDQTSVSGNAGTATALQTARNINGVSFNGTANITVTAAGSTLSDTVPVPKGGTGATTLTNHGVLIGQATGAVAVTGAGTTGQVLTSNGAAADPTFQAPPAIKTILSCTTFFFGVDVAVGTAYTAPSAPDPLATGVITVEDDAAFVMPFGGTLKNLNVRTVATTDKQNSPTTVITVRKNGVDTSLTVTMNQTLSTTTTDSTHTVSYAAGDRLTVKLVTTGASAVSTGIASITMEYDN